MRKIFNSPTTKIYIVSAQTWLIVCKRVINNQNVWQFCLLDSNKAADILQSIACNNLQSDSKQGKVIDFYTRTRLA